MKKNLKSYLFLVLMIGFFAQIKAQEDCILGVGITEDKTLISIFQMNEVQQENLINFGTELKNRNDILSNQLENLKNRHPQGTPTELLQLADKYKVVLDSMRTAQALIDKKVLKLFNEKQYQLYLSLCKEAARSPFKVIPSIYNDSIPEKNN